MAKKFYITTTLPYVNASPHIGFALELAQADALARWHKQAGFNVFFLTGTDEHGSKIFQTAKEKGTSPKKFANSISAEYKKLVKKLNVSNNYFIRTTDKKKHWPGVKKIWETLEKKGDIYKKKYTGKYCSGCERYITEKELSNGRCPDHPTRKIETISEENYFFRLSKYSNNIQKAIKSDKLEIRPKTRKNDFLSLIKNGLKDVSFSRNKGKLPWGIPVPGDKNQVMYVWCDALSNYLTGIGFPRKSFKKWWPADIHVAGKDMLRFHAGIWPGMLLSAGLGLPKEISVHGFITSEGKKMSKSVGNVVDPFKEIKKYGSDAVRYYLLREIPTGGDGDYSQKGITSRMNNELANELGNLVSRSLTLIKKFSGGKIPKGKFKLKFDLKKVQKRIDNRDLHKALEEIWRYVSKVNEYIADKKPWTKPRDLNNILFTLAESLRWISAATYPFIPETSEKIAEQLGLKKVPIFSELKKPIKAGTKIKKSKILFKKIQSKTHTSTKKKMKVKKMIEYSDFEKLDLRVGKITSVEDHPNADRLYLMKVNFGEETRQVLAGLKKWYKPKDLKGKQAVFVVNLKPRKIRGEKSEAMIMAAEQGKIVRFISPEKKIKTGAKIS